MAKHAHTTRRAIFGQAGSAAVVALASFLPAGVGAAPPTGLAAWRAGCARIAVNDAGVWPLIEEAHRQGFRPDQVICITLSANRLGPTLSLLDDNGETVRIYPDGTLRVFVRSGRAMSGKTHECLTAR